MTIDNQIQLLIDEAPDPSIAQAIQAIAPLLRDLAIQLKHLEYYILQNLDQGWVITTLSHRQHPEQTRKVVYAYPSLKMASGAKQALQDPNLMAVPYPVISLLFQLVSLKQIDSFIFLDADSPQQQGTEIKQAMIAQLIQTSLRSVSRTQIPSDIA
jgi:hypothetical protein